MPKGSRRKGSRFPKGTRKFSVFLFQLCPVPTRWYHMSWRQIFPPLLPAHSSWLQNQPQRQEHTQLHVSKSLPSSGQVVSKINTVTHQSGFPEMLVIVYWMTRLYNRGGSNCSRVYAPVTPMYCFAFHERQVLQPTQSLVGCNIFQKQIPKTYDVKDSFTSCTPDGPAYLTKLPQIHLYDIMKCRGTHGPVCVTIGQMLLEVFL